MLVTGALFASAFSLSASDFYKFSNVRKVDNNLLAARTASAECRNYVYD